MNNKSLIATLAVVSIVGGLVGGFILNKLTPLVGGDFAGGIVPSQLFTANSAATTLTPVVPNLNVPGSLSVGGTAANNQVTAFYTATAAYPAAAVTLGPIQATTSTTSTAVTFSASGFSIGDACQVGYNGNGTSTTPFGADAFITAYNTSTNAATATVTFWNGNSSAVTLTATSTVTGVSSTLKTTCFHTGV